MEEPEGRERDTIIVEEPGFQSGFTMVPNIILKAKGLTHGAKLCYAMLLSYAWQEDHCFPGQDRLADDLAVERMSVHRYLKELKDKGAIRVQRRGMMKTNVYTIVRLSDVSFLRHQDVTVVAHHDVTPSDHHDVTPTMHKEDPGKKTQGKKSFEASKATPLFSVVDNREPDAPGDGEPPRYQRKRAVVGPEVEIPLTRLMEDLSRDFGDLEHVTSNISQAINLYDASGLVLDKFFIEAYEARTATRRKTNVKAPMALFFSLLRERLGVTNGVE